MPSWTCIVTGASRGIGLATALRLARAGHSIVPAARDAAALEAAAQRITALGAACEPVVADVAQPAQAAALVERARQRFGRIDVLVNNAGLAVLKPTPAMSAAEFDDLLAVNVGAVFHLSRAAWNPMAAGGGGVIVNVSSLSSIDPFPGFAVYGACKAWVNLFTQALATEGRPAGIRVYAVAPGAVETAMLRASFPDLPPERVLSPDEVAAVIVDLCADHMAPASGQTIFVRR